LKKVVIIGAGISGMTAGIYAKKSGFDVEIYEKHTIPGGECTGWDRKDYHIDNCVHWMVGCCGKSECNHIWKTIGALDDSVGLVSLNSMYRSELNGEQITLWKDIERTRKELLELSPEDADEINDLMDYCTLAKKVVIPADKPSELMKPLDVLKLASSSRATIKVFQHYAKMDTADLMEKFHHPLIRCLLSDFCAKESMAYSFPMAYGNFAAGDGGLPRGGSRAMAQRIAKTFTDLGGKLYCDRPVKRIVPGDGRAEGIELEDGTRVSADYIIPACDINFTYGKLLGETYHDPIVEEFQTNREAYAIYGMFQAAFAVEMETNAIDAETILEAPYLEDFPGMHNRMTMKTYAYEPSFAPEGKQIVQVMLPMQEAGYEFWKTLAQNPKVYRETKIALAVRLMEKVERRFPIYEKRLRLLDCWTPVTYERYCNAYKGYNQAFIPTKKSNSASPSPYVSGLDNVVLAGQWLSPPGGLPGAAIMGKFAVQRILKKENRKIRL
jgi:phytoene dehydrogenase-like protein